MTNKTTPLINEDGEVRDLTNEDLKNFKPLREVNPKLAKRLSEYNESIRNTRGEQIAPKKADVHIKLDAAIVEHFKKDGKGWQTRLNETLRNALGL